MNLGTYTEKAAELIPAGIYTLRLDNIEVVDKNPQYVEEGQDGKQWKWSWCVMDGPAKGKSLTSWSNRTINKGSTAKPWVEGLLGRPLVEGEGLDSDAILEQTMKAYVSKTVTQSGKEVNRIKDVVEEGDAPTPIRDASVGDLREYLTLRAKLVERGIKPEALDRKENWSLGGKEFAAATTANQQNLLEILRDWLKNFEAYDPDGDVPFGPTEEAEPQAATAGGGKRGGGA